MNTGNGSAPFDSTLLPEVGRNNLWYRYSDSETVLIFVHGVLSDSRSCWLSAGEGGTYWPRLVAEDSSFGEAGIYLGGYYTAVDAGRYEIRNAADELFSALNRGGTSSVLARNRLIFVCHSTGGLVVRHILTTNDHLFLNKTVGLVLIASPSYGSRWANRARWLTSFYGHSIGKQLASGHWTVKEIDAQFKNLLNERRIPKLVGVEAYENHFIFHRKWLPDKQVIVTEESVGRYFGSPILLRNTDHFSTVKPTSREHPSYELLGDFFEKHFRTDEAQAPPNSLRPYRLFDAAAALLFSHPVDLCPPPCVNSVSRPTHVAMIKDLADIYFGVVVEGRHKYGKSYIAREFITWHAGEQRVLWYNLTPGGELKDVLARLSSIEQPLVAWPGHPIPSLLEWLRTTDTMLVIDGLDHTNQHSFSPLLQLISRVPGPCRIVVTSSIRSAGANAYEVGPLSGDEAIAILGQLKTVYDRNEIRAMANEGALSPFALRQAAARFGQVNRQYLTVGMNALHTEMVALLPQDLRSVIEVLQVLNAEFDLGVLSEVLDELQVRDTPQQVLTKLENVLLIKHTSAGTWRLEASKSELTPIYLSTERLSAVLVRLARHYRGKVARGGGIPRDLTLADCMNLFAACRLLQFARSDKPERDRLRLAFATAMERYGAFRQLALMYLFELEEGELSDEWLRFKYARALFVIGRYDDAIAVLDAALRKLVGDADERNEDLYLSLCRLMAEILIEVGQTGVAVKVLDGALDNADVANLGGVICVQAVSVLSWALVKANMPKECIELNDDILDKQFEGLALPFSRQVSNIRVGVALRDLRRVPESIASLNEACRFFEKEDARAYAWGMAHLAVSLHLAGDFAEARRALQGAIETNATNNLFNSELDATYQMFALHPEYVNLAPALLSERERIASFELKRLDLGRRLADTKLVEHVLLDLGVKAAEPFTFDKAKYELFSLSSPHAMASKFNKNLVARLREANIELVLERIFTAKPIVAIFRSHIYNRIITVACKDAQVLAKKFIYPHLDTIEKQTDSILFLYARYFEASGDLRSAERLLENVRWKEESFSYYNIKANCASHEEPFVALKLNDEALRLCRSRQQRAQILHNKASIVYNRGIRDMFEEAKEWCDRSTRLATKRPFHWPRNLLLKLSLATCESEGVEDVILAHRERFRVPTPILVKVVSEVKNHRLREAVLDVIRKLG